VIYAEMSVLSPVVDTGRGVEIRNAKAVSGKLLKLRSSKLRIPVFEAKSAF